MVDFVSTASALESRELQARGAACLKSFNMAQRLEIDALAGLSVVELLVFISTGKERGREGIGALTSAVQDGESPVLQRE